MRRNHVATVVLNYNGFADTAECIDSLGRVDSARFRHSIVVVDNFTSSDERHRLDTHLPMSVHRVFLDENVGYAAGNNAGIRFALDQLGADWVFVLNNDTVVDHDCLERLLGVAADETVGIVCPLHYFHGTERVVNYAGGEIHWHSYYHGAIGVNQVDAGQFGTEPFETTFASGAAMLLSRRLLDSVGHLDERLFLLYEDLDISVRAHLAGFKVLVHPCAIIWHKESRSFAFRRGFMSPLRAYYSARNQIWFRYKYSSPWQYAAFLVSFVLFRVPLHNAYWIWKERTLSCTLSFAKGVVDGVRGAREYRAN